MKMPKWMCYLLFSKCDWKWVQNRYKSSSNFIGLYDCRRCGAHSEGSPRNALTGEGPVWTAGQVTEIQKDADRLAAKFNPE